MSTCITETATAASSARTAMASIGAAIRTSTLPAIVRLVVWTVADLAAVAADAGEPFAICLEEVADATGMRPSHVAHAIADLIDHGWLTRTQAGWYLDAPAPRTGT
jgi:predicted transcriptional regulator of viral defense system